MVELQAIQDGMVQTLRSISEGSFLLRVSKHPTELWVCDLPRRQTVMICQSAKEVLERQGIVVTEDDKAQLWRLDVSISLLEKMIRPCEEMEELPEDDSLHAAYALYRLLCLHPAPLPDQPIEELRYLLKACNEGEMALLKAVAWVHQRCAVHLRNKEPLPSSGASLLHSFFIKKAMDK